MSGLAAWGFCIYHGIVFRRSFLFLFTLFLLLAAIAALASPAQATTYVSGTISTNTTWTTEGSPYVIQGSSVSVAAGVTLIINSGVVVKFQSQSGVLTINGTLSAAGATFTSYKDDSAGGDTNGDGSATAPAQGDWGYIAFYADSSGSLSDCQVSYGGWYGSTYNHASVYISGASPVISNSRISNSLGYGIYAVSGTPTVTGSSITGSGYGGVLFATSPAAFYSNRLEDNHGFAVMLPADLGEGLVYANTYSGNQVNAMLLSGYNITRQTQWPASNSPYVFNAFDLTVNSGVTLTIEPGAVVKPFSSGGTIKVNGALSAQGTSAQPIVFTSYKDDSAGGDTNGDGSATAPAPGDWGYIAFYADSSGSLSDCQVSYGGWYGGVYNNGSIYISGAAPSITSSSISKSKGIGVYIVSGAPSIHYNDIFANTTYGLRSNIALDATRNYWGSKHGPKPYGSGNGYSGPVTVAPWSQVPNTQAGADYRSTLGFDEYCALCGDPINTATGAFVYEHQDIKIPTRGLPLEFKRTYNSNDPSDGPLGYGWSNTWQLSTSVLANGNVIVLRGDGRQDIFTRNAGSSYSPPPRSHDTLVKNANGTYSLTTQDQVTYNFGSENQLVSEVSETGQTTTLTYDANKRLTIITEPAGRTLSFTYNAGGRIDEITDPQSNTVSFLYSTAGDLTQVTDQNGSVTHFVYDSYHRVTGVTDPNNHTSANNSYDAQGRVTSQTNAEGKLLTFAYDTVGRKTTMTTQMDPNDPIQDQVRDFYYDTQLRLTRQTDPYGHDTFFTYDSQGNRDSATDRRDVETRQTHDAYGNVVDIYKAYGLSEGQHTNYTYNAKNHPLTRTDSRGETTSYNYDASGTYLQEITYPRVTDYNAATAVYAQYFTYNADGTVATATDRNGDVTSYTYDAYGNPALETKNTNCPTADQVTLSFVYDSLGRKTSETDGNGHTSSYQYDNLGNLRFITKHVTDPGTGQPVDVVTENQYDAVGNRVKIIDAEGKNTLYSYTAMNRLSQITDANLNTIQYTYDAAGNKTGTKDRNGNWSYIVFDKNNRMASATDPENNTTTYGYDEEGNQTSATDPLGRQTAKTYDRVNRAISASEPDEGGATRTTTYAYDAADHLTSTTDPLNHTTTNTYDELGRLKQVTDPLSNSIYSAYDGVGNRVKVKDPGGNEISFGFSPNDWLTSVTEPGGGITSYAYDKAANRTSQTDAEGHVTIYSYDELNREQDEKVDAGSGNYLLARSYTYDKAGHQLTDTTGEGAITSTYDDVYNLTGATDRQSATYSFTYDNNQNQLTAIDNSNGKTVAFSYSPRGQLSQATGANGGSESYSYDGAGNLSQRQDSVAGQNFTTSYAYTPRDQLKQVTRGTDTTSYSFDAAGNLATKNYGNGVDTAYTHDADNRLTAMQATKNGQTLQSFSHGYDANGNITSYTEAAGATSYSYDALNRETSENIAGYGAKTYSYDPAGNRTQMTEPAKTSGPVLSLSMTKVYWASYSDWQNHLLSIDYSEKDNGPGTAYASQITGATATGGVYLSTSVPVPLGDIAQGEGAPVTLKYFIPAGVSRFSTTVYADCKDQSGNIYAFPTNRTTYSYNQAGQLTQSYDQAGVATSYSYNAAGTLIQKSNPTAATTYSYNGLDKLTQVTTPTATVGYTYDALGRRISRTDTNGTINYQLNGKSDLTDYDTDGSGNLTGAYERGADGLISQTDYTGPSPATSYYLYDLHGDTSATTDQNGNVTGSYRYDSFGNAIAGNPPAVAYTGKWQRETDGQTGLIRMGVREYDPDLGRFISPDQIKNDPAVPQAGNRYEYSLNNPLRFNDISGLYPGENYVDTALMFGEWLTGTGPQKQEFGPGSPQVEDMRGAPGIQDAIDQFYQQNEGRSCNQYLPLPAKGEGFGLSGAFHAGLNPTQQFVGGYVVDISPNQDHTITITVHNRTSWSSFLYHVYPDFLNPGSIDVGPFELSLPGSNTYQTYTWTEPMR